MQSNSDAIRVLGKPHGDQTDMTDLDQRIRAYYGGQTLSPEVHARLSAMVSAGLPRRDRDRWNRLRMGAVAAFLLAVTASILWIAGPGRHRGQSPEEIAGVLARQAALCHNGKHQLEFRAGTTADLTARMKSLDFTLVEPEIMKKANMRVVGARYTTLDGALAAQVSYVDAGGEPCTLYVMRAVDRLAAVPDVEQQLDGTRVTIWREKGLLMILARPLA